MDSGTDNFRQKSTKVCLIFMSDRRQVAFRPLFYVQRTREREEGKREERDKEGQGRGTATFPSFLWTLWNAAPEEGVLHHLPLCPPPQPCFPEGITRLHVEPKQGCSSLTELQGSGSLWPCRPVAWQLKQWDRVLGAGFRTVSAVGHSPSPLGRGEASDTPRSVHHHHPSPWQSKVRTPDTYKHLNGDRNGAVERGVASILGHDC